MLSNVEKGWVEFRLEGTSLYGLSYLNDIALEWLEQAVHGLETLMPFTVKGFMEPTRFLCTVSYWNCHIICEDEDRMPLNKSDMIYEISHTSMLQFCRYLYDDISRNFDAWVDFAEHARKENITEKEHRLKELLLRLKELISEREEYFGENRCFL